MRYREGWLGIGLGAGWRLSVLLAVGFPLVSQAVRGAETAHPVVPAATEIELVAELQQGPGNITLTPAGEVILSLHQFYAPEQRVVKLADDGRLLPFATGARLDTVLGLQADAHGIVWLLDNAMRSGGTRRLIGWDPSAQRALKDIDLTAVTTDRSFLNDLAVDSESGTVYIADPAGGADAALIVVDTDKGRARRLLQGHSSVTPEAVDLIIDGTPVRIKAEDGSLSRPHVGVNPIALDHSNAWLYFGPMHGHSLYRVSTAALNDASLTAEALAGRVERWADKPICDGISIDAEGNIYLGDLANNAIGMIDTERRYRVLIEDPRLAWVDAFSFGPDGRLYTVANQLHRSAMLNGGESAIRPPFLVLRFQPLAPGRVGR